MTRGDLPASPSTSSGHSKLPRLVVLAAIKAGIDLKDLFCYSITPSQIALTLSGTGETVWVDREGLESPPAPQRGEGRKFGPAPEDTRAQAAPGRAEAGPCDEVK